METNIEKREIESTFTAETQSFTIEASAKAFQILSSNLYTDKPLAIVRELSANALDAHNQAKQDKPFELSLPNRMNPSFEIRDFGIGMSPDTIKTLYTTFFGSDKNHDNNAVGGLGLGSKTPFSYTDTFTLISYWLAMEYTWLCTIEEDGHPSISLVKSCTTTKERGIHYIIPVKQEDFSTFSSKAHTVLKYFPVGSYKADDITVTPVEYTLKRDDYGIRASTGSYPRIIMGPIAYRLDRNAIAENLRTGYSSILGNSRMDIFCNIGDVDIQASREALSYDKKSQKQIIEVVARVKRCIKKDTDKDIADCDNYLEACNKGVSLSGSTSLSFDDLGWKGRPLQRHFTIDGGGATIISGNGNLTASDALSLSFSSYCHVSIMQAKIAPVIFYDSSIKFNKIRLKTLLMQDRVKEYIVFSNEGTMRDWMTEIQATESTSTEDLPLPEKEDATYRAVVRSKVHLKIKILNNSWKTFDETIEHINELENACWVPLEGGGSNPWKHPDDNSRYNLLCKFDSAVQVIGIPRSLKRKTKYITIPTLEEYLRAAVIEVVDTEERYDAAFRIRSNITWLDEIHGHALKKWEKLELCKLSKIFMATKALRAEQERIHVLLDWKFKIDRKETEERDKPLMRQYKAFNALSKIYSHNITGEFINEVLRLIHGDRDAVHKE